MSGLMDTGRNAFARGDFLWKAGQTQWRCSLVGTNFTPLVSHTIYGDVTAVQGSTWTMVPSDPTAGVCDATDAVFTAVTTNTNTISHVVIYVLGTVNSLVNPLMCFVDFSAVTPNGGDITIQWDEGTNKIFKL